MAKKQYQATNRETKEKHRQYLVRLRIKEEHVEGEEERVEGEEEHVEGAVAKEGGLGDKNTDSEWMRDVYSEMMEETEGAARKRIDNEVEEERHIGQHHMDIEQAVIERTKGAPYG